jgi:hypothetical protein
VKETTIEQVPATTRERDIIVCDGCGTQKEGLRWHDPDRSNSMYRGTEVTVEIKRVRNYPGDGDSRADAWDFCPTCFDQKVRPLLETIAMPRKVEESW